MGRQRCRPTAVPELVRAAAAEFGGELPDRFDRQDDGHVELAAGLLLQRFRRRDDVAAFTLLVELCEARLRALAARITRQIAVVLDPDDLVARFMARLFIDVRRDEPVVERFLALAWSTMRFDALNQLRLDRRARARGASWQAMVAERHPPVDPAEVVVDREGQARLPRLGALFLAVASGSFHALKARERRILHAREVVGLSYDEIAAAMGLPRAQVGMILKRARQRLAHSIETALSHAPAPRGGRHGASSPRPIHRRPLATAVSDPTS